MSALSHLSNLLQRSLNAAERPFPNFDDLDPIIASLQKHNKTGTGANIPEDLQLSAVRKFWGAQRFETLKDARLVSFGLCVPSHPSGPSIMEDRQRFLAVLDAKTGVDQWANEPRWYRRCYQGLMRSYFAYDAKINQTPAIAKQNWGDLRDYLNQRTQNIVDNQVNPDWVTTAVKNRSIFSDDPCTPYGADVLSGNTTKIGHLCEQLGVVKSSWFLRELVLAPVRQAIKLNHESFKALIPRLLELLATNIVLRDLGLILMLNKYASASQPDINEPLRSASFEWWGNPWLPSNEMRWGGVVPAAREMVSEWLKREFIEDFFTKLAEGGIGDRRRANFWLRYVKSMDIQFALGSRTLHSRDRDFEALRKKMKGLYTELKATDASNNAFIMTLGNLVAVEFGGLGNAFYGYDVRKTLPFDASRPVGTVVDAPNSLKHKYPMLRMRHQDGINGWNRWEDMFEATLKEHFEIRPNATPKHVAQRVAGPSPTPVPPPLIPRTSPPPVPTDPPPSQPAAHIPDNDARHTQSEKDFSKVALYAYAEVHGLRVEDLKEQNGNLWVRTGNKNRSVNRAMLDWGFRYKPNKGWWR